MLELSVGALNLSPVLRMLSGRNSAFPKKEEKIVFLICFWECILVLEHLSNVRKTLGSRTHWGKVTDVFGKASLKTLLNGKIVASQLSHP